jgi:peptidoglycan LD-endopeptidase CwlK
MFSLSKVSRDNMTGVNPLLVKIVERAITYTKVDFRVIEGLRSPERQAELFKDGKSQTLKSKHITGQAVDLCALVEGKVSWDWRAYWAIAEAMKRAASELGVKDLVWGGDWRTFKDGPHFQLGQ